MLSFSSPCMEGKVCGSGSVCVCVCGTSVCTSVCVCVYECVCVCTSVCVCVCVCVCALASVCWCTYGCYSCILRLSPKRGLQVGHSPFPLLLYPSLSLFLPF